MNAQPTTPPLFLCLDGPLQGKRVMIRNRTELTIRLRAGEAHHAAVAGRVTYTAHQLAHTFGFGHAIFHLASIRPVPPHEALAFALARMGDRE